jgi:hypothetical protein
MRQQRVHQIHERGQPECLKNSAERSSRLELEQKRNAPALNPRNECSVAQCQPPAFASLIFRDISKKANRYFICKREQSKLFTLVHLGDDPRRPSTESSSARVEQNGALQVSHRVHVLLHAAANTVEVICDMFGAS